MTSGISRIGKTTLAVMLAERLQQQFELLIWRSLKSTPPMSAIVPDGMGVSPYASTEMHNVPTRMLMRLRDGLRPMFRYDDSSIGEELREILPLLRGKSAIAIGYVGCNLRELLDALGIDLHAYDWQDIPMR